MLALLLNGDIFLFCALLFTITFSLTFHEFGHAACAKLLGDDTAERMGRLTLNPVAHIDPIGLLMVITVGFGYAKPVPVNPMLLKKAWGNAAVAAAGPMMNFLIALVCVNVLALGIAPNQAAQMLFMFLAQINLLLMLFNLLPIGPLDGHYIMSWLLPPSMRISYDHFNYQYGTNLFLGLILLSVMGVPIFHFLTSFSQRLMSYLVVV